MSEETKLLIDQIERMNNFYMWSVAIFITIIISFVGFFSFVQFKLSENQKKKIVKETEAIIKVRIFELTEKFKLKEEISEINVHHRYGLNIAASFLDGKGAFLKPSLPVNIFFKNLSNIDTFISKYTNNKYLDEETIENLSKLICADLSFINNITKRTEKEESIILEELNMISDYIAKNKQYVYRLCYSELFKSNESLEKSFIKFEKYISQLEEKVRTIEAESNQTPNQP